MGMLRTRYATFAPKKDRAAAAGSHQLEMEAKSLRGITADCGGGGYPKQEGAASEGDGGGEKGLRLLISTRWMWCLES
jgi:hypothetical protein